MENSYFYKKQENIFWQGTIRHDNTIHIVSTVCQPETISSCLSRKEAMSLLKKRGFTEMERMCLTPSEWADLGEKYSLHKKGADFFGREFFKVTTDRMFPINNEDYCWEHKFPQFPFSVKKVVHNPVCNTIRKREVDRNEQIGLLLEIVNSQEGDWEKVKRLWRPRNWNDENTGYTYVLHLKRHSISVEEEEFQEIRKFNAGEILGMWDTYQQGVARIETVGKFKKEFFNGKKWLLEMCGFSSFEDAEKNNYITWDGSLERPHVQVNSRVNHAIRTGLHHVIVVNGKFFRSDIGNISPPTLAQSEIR